MEQSVSNLNKKLTLLSLFEVEPNRALEYKSNCEEFVELKVMMCILKQELQNAKDNTQTLKELAEEIYVLRKRLNHLQIHFPKGNAPRIPSATVNIPIPTQFNEIQNENQPVKKKRSQTAQIDSIDEELFKSIPKHVKGHVSLSQLNAGIKEVNIILKKKYEFLERPRKSLTYKEEKKRSLYIELGKDLRNTPHSIFFSDQDILDYSTMLKVKKKTRSDIFLMLRHIGKMKETRKAKIPRYCILF